MDHWWSHALLTNYFGWIKSDWEWKRKRPVKVKTRLGQFFPSSATQRGPSWTNLSDRIWPIRGRYSAPSTNQKPPLHSVMILSLNRFLVSLGPSQSLAAAEGSGESGDGEDHCLLEYFLSSWHFLTKDGIPIVSFVHTTLFGKLSASWPAPPFGAALMRPEQSRAVISGLMSLPQSNFANSARLKQSVQSVLKRTN